ncbi:phosphotransferase [Streptomyces viridiviolaceus]|uniref:Phosphotransferase n=1 Tax=Streptomyces viridiviolaceus TaxID=68282 RepID=A0ABW2E340_9ACTN|nr:phosphotransferase [Streptomyces viridiviolaceus]
MSTHPADPPQEVRQLTEQAVGHIAAWTDTSWDRESSRVWRARGAHGEWYVKVHQNARFHHREVEAYRSRVPRLGASAPTLVAHDSALHAVVVTAVPGHPLHGLAHPPEQRRRLFHEIGSLAATIHRSAATPIPTTEGVPELAKVERHLAAARPYLNREDEEFIRSTVARAEEVPSLARVPAHGDFQLRNLLLDEDGSLSVIDFGRSEPGPAIRDLVRLSDAWATQPCLHDAFMSGYGRGLTPAEEESFVIDSTLDALSGIQYGATRSDAETQEPGAPHPGAPATPRPPPVNDPRKNPAAKQPRFPFHGPQPPTVQPQHRSEAKVPDDTQQAIPAVPSPTTGDEPQEHHMHLLPRYYRQVEAGRKTIEVRVATPQKRAVAAGDTVVFHDRETGRELDVIVQRITPYPSFEDLLRSENPTRINPDGSPEELLANLRNIYPPAKENLGVLAIEFDHRPGRQGRPIPMTPAEYVRTVPHHTAYGCLYIRDEHDRPVQLRSVYGNRLWQFPGGNTDTGEDPLETARREATEETGLELGQGRPRLLLTHYLHPGPHWPMGKIGFIFDGGNLTTEQLRRIRLDPAEHDMWAVHDLPEWQRLMGEVPFARLEATERARTGDGPHYLVSGRPLSHARTPGGDRDR